MTQIPREPAQGRNAIGPWIGLPLGLAGGLVLSMASLWASSPKRETVPLQAQSAIENPAVPKAKNAGRVVVPKEILAITDEATEAYYFKQARGLTTAPDGSLFVIDENQLLRFSQDGKFLGNLFKKGQGPGEMAYVGACLFTDKNIVVQATYPDKFLWFDYSGKYEREAAVRSQTRGMRTGLLENRGVIYLESWTFPAGQGTPGFIEIPHDIISIDESSAEAKSLATFPTRAYVISAPGGGGGMFPIGVFVSAPFGAKMLAVSHRSEYLLKIYDPVANKVVREFRRDYKRVKAPPLTDEQKKGGIMIGNQHYGPPEQEYKNDIDILLSRGDEIWAVTSTREKTKGVLIDVFDGEGVYRDAFWLHLPEPALDSLANPGRACTLTGEFLWVVERAEDETVAIKKYRVDTK